jgi:hypothetical protein
MNEIHYSDDLGLYGEDNIKNALKWSARVCTGFLCEILAYHSNDYEVCGK